MPKTDIFKDLVVVELASALAGPSVGMFFAELGARVVKIENINTGGDVTRRWKHPTEDPEDAYSAYFYSTNWHKESLMLDLKNPLDRSKVHELVIDADVVVCNFKPGSAAKIGMDYKSLKDVNSSIIYGSISAYGEDDHRPGFDALMQAETGWMSINGDADGLPTKVPLPIIDILAGHQLKEGILCALIERSRTGMGCKVSASLYDASIASLTNQAATLLNLNITPKRMGSQHPSIAPYGDLVTTSDGIVFLLAVGTEAHFEGLCKALDAPSICLDKRFTSNQDRIENRSSLVKLLQEAAEKYTSQQFESACDENNVPLAPVRDLGQVFADRAAQSLILTEDIEGRTSKRVRTSVFKIEQVS